MRADGDKMGMCVVIMLCGMACRRSAKVCIVRVVVEKSDRYLLFVLVSCSSFCVLSVAYH